MNHNYLNISIIRKMLANSYIISKEYQSASFCPS